jgi:hypothetical protein
MCCCGFYFAQAAELKWEADKINMTVERRGKGSGLRLAVMGIPVTKGIVSVTLKRSLAASSQLCCATEVEQAMKRMRFGAFDANLAGPEFSQVGGSVFGHGAASSGTAASASSGSAMAMLQDIDAQPMPFTKLQKVADLKLVSAVDDITDDELHETPPVAMSPRFAKHCVDTYNRTNTRIN